MISVQSVVHTIVSQNEEALSALCGGFMNLSAYAKQIKKQVQELSKKEVQLASIIIALSRLQKIVKKSHPIIANVVIDEITTKLPLSEIAYEKTPETIKALQKVHTYNSEKSFLTMTISTHEITIICSTNLVEKIKPLFGREPKKLQNELAAICLSFNEAYYNQPNITYSLLRKLAVQKINLAETISTYTEVIFVFHQESLAKVVSIFAETP